MRVHCTIHLSTCVYVWIFFFTHTHCILFLQEINRLTPSIGHGWREIFIIKKNKTEKGCQEKIGERWERKYMFWEFPGSPVVRTQRFHSRCLGSILGWGTKIPQASWRGQKIKKLKELKVPVLWWRQPNFDGVAGQGLLEEGILKETGSVTEGEWGVGGEQVQTH